MLRTFSPLLELTRLQEDINRLLGELSNHMSGGSLHDSSKWVPNVDLCEDAKQLLIKVELPGVAKEHIQVVYQEGFLRISGETKNAAPSVKAHYLCLERSYGKFSRIVHLNSVVDMDAATARMHNGILTILLPKLPNRRRTEKVIPVE
jgi:HSP20 family protein